MDKPIIEKITVVRMIDDCPDVSYLETTQDEQGNILTSDRYTQEEYLENPEQVQGYIDEDKQRLEDFNEGNIYMTGIQAKAEVSYTIFNGTEQNHVGTAKRLERFASGGLWGIESDSGDDYFKEVQADELADLKDHLERFNVDVSNFDELAKDIEIED